MVLSQNRPILHNNPSEEEGENMTGKIADNGV